jgi:hypothetical protein
LRHNERDPDSLPDDRILAMLRSRDGTLWVATFAGLVRRGPGDRAFVRVPLPTPDGKVALVWTLFEDTQQRLWIGTHRQGAYIIESRDTAARQVPESDPAHSTLPTEGVHTIAEVRPGEVWLGTFGHGIVAVDTVSFRTRRIRHDPMLQESLADDGVIALYKDRSGLVWICSARAISRYDPGQTAVYTIIRRIQPPRRFVRRERDRDLADARRARLAGAREQWNRCCGSRGCSDCRLASRSESPGDDSFQVRQGVRAG